ncbi:MAG TPA: alpha/beta fold hydrolase [Pseudonocardiaceae bacterium]|jgi:hypothetical protein|nr:alpha/beta fold hydrolase [Pseudonocardiaceae bacterium]
MDTDLVSARLRPREVTFTSADVRLGGSLTVPDRASFAGVVMVGGSGPADRTNDGYFPAIQRQLAGAGIAVLSYDKRGVGASSGEWRDTTLAGLAGDALVALDFLRAQPGVRVDDVGLFGHSEGGWVALHAAARAEVPWVITNSCPGMTPASQDRYALATVLRTDDLATQQDIDSSLALYDRLIEAGRRDADFAEATRIVGSAAAPSAFTEYYWADVDERLWEFLKRKQDHDPVPDALRLRCPHLAIFGAADQLVPVVDSVHLFTAAACHPSRPLSATLTVRVFPGADHRIQTSGTIQLAPGYLQLLTRWIDRHGT